jgi:aspartate/methionine/tyrosine aminotransferase
MEKSATLRMNEQMQDFVAHGIPALNLGFGECGLPVLPVLRELVAAGSAENAYPAVQGSLAARRAIAGYFSRRGIPSEAALCTVAPGSKPILYALLATLSGDLVLPRPSWVSYANQSRALGKPVIWVDAPADCGGIPDPDQLEAALDEARAAGRDPRILLLTSPDNPTGTVAGGEQMRALVRIAAEQNLTIISDEIYRDLAYSPADYVSPAELAPDRTIVTSGLSKNLALGGWRVGVARFPVTDRGRKQLARFVGFASELWSGMPVFLEPVVEYTFSEPADVVERIAASRRPAPGGLHRHRRRAARCRCPGAPAGGRLLCVPLVPGNRTRRAPPRRHRRGVVEPTARPGAGGGAARDVLRRRPGPAARARRDRHGVRRVGPGATRHSAGRRPAAGSAGRGRSRTAAERARLSRHRARTGHYAGLFRSTVRVAGKGEDLMSDSVESSANLEDQLSNLVAHPDQAQRAGERIAAHITATGADVVAVDPQPASIILGHLVAARLGATLTIVSEDSGLLYATETPAPGARVALVSADFPDYPSPAATADYLSANSARIVAAVSLLPIAGSAAGLPVTPVSVGA